MILFLSLKRISNSLPRKDIMLTWIVIGLAIYIGANYDFIHIVYFIALATIWKMVSEIHDQIVPPERFDY